jgi:hypothetical protein
MTDRDTGFGIGYIRSSEYLAWAQLNGIAISKVELTILKALDNAYVKHHHSKPDDDMKVVSEQPLSTDLFDTMF